MIISFDSEVLFVDKSYTVVHILIMTVKSYTVTMFDDT